MKRLFRMSLLAAAALLSLVWTVSCESASPEFFWGGLRSPEQVVSTYLAISFEPGSVHPQTRMLDTITQVDADTDASVFRGIEQIYMIPFGTLDAISAADTRISRNVDLPQTGIAPVWNASANNGNHSGLVSNNNSHLYANLLLKVGMSSVLAYGKAIDASVSTTPTDSVDFKRRNGVLRAHGLESARTPDGISFTLEPIVDASAQTSLNTTLQGVIDYLNSIAAAQVSHTGYTRRSRNETTWTWTWKTPSTYSNHQTLEGAFATLTGNGLAFSGSTDAIAGMLTSIYNGLYNLATSTSESNGYNQPYYGYYSTQVSGYYYYVYQLSNRIRELINNSNYVTLTGSGNNVTISFNSNYAGIPASFGVPDGAVAIEWNGSEFVIVSAASSTLAPLDSYCYPPSLWYWTGSNIQTTDDGSVINQYVSSNTTWASILSQYTLGRMVRPGVAAAAITKPLQYGVAQLRLRFNYAVSAGGTEMLLDSKAAAISVSNSNFPFTGLLVSEQKDLAFNFTPKSSTSYCIYDSEVYNGSSPKVWIAGESTGLTFQPVHTLVVQTEAGQDIHYALEFQNNSGSPFYGANSCIIPAGGKFYLMGVFSLEDATNNTGETINSVFVQDRITEAVITINGLAKAYNTIPELRDPQLEIGVKTEMRWVGSTPENIPMY